MWAGTGGGRQLHLQRLGSEFNSGRSRGTKRWNSEVPLPEATTCLTEGGCRFTPRSQAPLSGSVPPIPSCSSSTTSNQNSFPSGPEFGICAPQGGARRGSSSEIWGSESAATPLKGAPGALLTQCAGCWRHPPGPTSTSAPLTALSPLSSKSISPLSFTPKYSHSNFTFQCVQESL